MANEVPQFVDADSLELRIGSATFIELFDDDNDGVADPAPLDFMLNLANADMMSRLLKKGFSAAQMEAICDSPILVNCAAEICMGYSGERRSEWLNDNGDGRYEGIRKRARAQLVDLATAALRDPVAEARGQGTTQPGGKISKYKRPITNFIVAVDQVDRDRGSRGSGGF